jgi:hypothetical protein
MPAITRAKTNTNGRQVYEVATTVARRISRSAISKLGIAALAVTLLSGCLDGAPGIKGAVGATKDSQGKLAYVVFWCDRPPNRLTIYHVDDSRTGDPNPTDVVYEVSGLKSHGSTTVSASNPPPPWTVTTGTTNLSDNLTYTAQAAGTGKSTSMFSVDFRLADVERLASGQVLYQVDGPPQVAVSAAEFVSRMNTIACR